jgi:hypothetical protein
MKAELKTKVVAALRSGSYEKDTNRACYLRTKDNCFCVMGVVADVVDPAGWRRAEDGAYRHRGRLSDLDQALREEIDLPYDKMWDLIKLNDDSEKKLTFAQLADHIEAHF